MPKNIKQLSVKIIIATFGMALLAVTAWAATPSFMNYHSRLRDASGFPISASTSIRFTIYNDATNGNGNTQATSAGGPVLWSELYDQGLGNCAQVQPDDRGYFTAKLGSCIPFPPNLDFTTSTLYLGVTIGTDLSSNTEASPRVQFGAAPYAFNAKRVGNFYDSGANSLVGEALGTATAGSNFNSASFLLNGSAWTGSAATSVSMVLQNIVTSQTVYKLQVANASGAELFSINQSGVASTTQLVVAQAMQFTSTTPTITLGSNDSAGILTVKDSAATPNTLMALSDSGTAGLLTVGTVSTTQFVLGVDSITDLTGAGLKVVANALRAEINLSTDQVTSTLGIDNGGTNATSGQLTANQIIVFDGTRMITTGYRVVDFMSSSSVTTSQFTVLGDTYLATTTISTTLTVQGNTYLATTSLTFLNASTVNAANASFTNATSGNLYVYNSTAGNSTTTNLYVSNSATFNTTTFNGPVTMATTTVSLLNASSSFFTNATATNFYASNFTASTGTFTGHLSFTTASGTALTLTSNLWTGGMLQVTGTSTLATTTIAALTVSGTSTLGATVLSGFTAGSALFVGANSQIAQDNSNFYWDDTNNRLGLGTSTPAQRLTINGGNIFQYSTGTISKISSSSANYANGLSLSGKILAVSDNDSGAGNAHLDFYDISDRANMSLLSTYTSVQTSDYMEEVFIASNFAYTAASSGMHIIDISNPKAPVLAGFYATPSTTKSIYVSGKYAYLGVSKGTGVGGLYVIDISSSTNPVLTGNVAVNTGSNHVFDIVVRGKYAYLAADGDGLKIVDISNPASPAVVGTYYSAGPTNPSGYAAGVYVSGKYAYLADLSDGLDNGGMKIIDISDPTSPTLAANYDLGARSVNNIIVNGRYAYLSIYNFTNGELQIVDIASSTAPFLTSKYADNLIYDVALSGKTAFVADWTGGVVALDISGADLPTLNAGNIETSFANITENAVVANSLYVGSGLTVGPSGIKSGGGLAFDSTSSASYFAYRLGIGTTTPAYPLDVVGNARISGTTTLGAYDITKYSGTDNQVLTYVSGKAVWQTPAGGGLPNGTVGYTLVSGGGATWNATNTLVVTSSALGYRVGINTTTPAFSLDVAGTVNASTSGYRLGTNKGIMHVSTSAALTSWTPNGANSAGGLFVESGADGGFSGLYMDEDMIKLVTGASGNFYLMNGVNATSFSFVSGGGFGMNGGANSFIWATSNPSAMSPGVGRLGILEKTGTDAVEVRDADLAVYGTSTMRNILPEANLTYSLGNASYRWLNMYASTTYIGSGTWQLLQEGGSGAFIIQDTGGNRAGLLYVSSTKGVAIGTTTVMSQAFNLDGAALFIPTSTTPASVTGSMYYDLTNNRFSFFQNGAWSSYTAASGTAMTGVAAGYNSVAYWADNSTLAGTSTFIYNATSSQLGLGATSSQLSAMLQINTTGTIFNNLLLSRTHKGEGELTIQSNTTSIAINSLELGTMAFGNVSLGPSAGVVALGGVTAIGYQAGHVTVASTTLVGYQAGLSGPGIGLTAIGYQAATANGGGAFNTAVGYSALAANSSNDNTAVGYNSLALNAAANNTAFGSQSLSVNVNGIDNTAIGYHSMKAFNPASSDANNTAVGSDVLPNLQQGSGNTALGYNTGLTQSSGDSNIFLGSNIQAEPGYTTADYRLYIDADAPDMNTPVPPTPPFQYAIVGQLKNVAADGTYGRIPHNAIGINSSQADLDASLLNFYVYGAAGGTTPWNTLSDANLKDVNGDIFGSALGIVNALHPVKYKWNDLANQEFQLNQNAENYGFLAQEVNNILPSIVGSGGKYWMMRYEGIIPILTAAIQEQQAQIEALRVATSSFAGNVTVSELKVEGRLIVKDNVTLGLDTVGQVMVPTGQASAHIAFSKAYDTLPIITVTPIGIIDAKFGVDNITKSGFDLVVSPAQNQEMFFNWHAFAIADETKIIVANSSPVVAAPFVPSVLPTSTPEVAPTSTEAVNSSSSEPIINNEIATSSVSSTLPEAVSSSEPIN
ncbi:MAG: tail fiber domain-containing protein [Candidatus Paceibacterota bacterium]